MKKAHIVTLVMILFLWPVVYWPASADTTRESPPISGKVVDGYRILSIQKTSDKIDLTVYRGDYIKFAFDESLINPVLSIPSLSIDQKLPGDPDDAPYFKMKNTGTYAFALGTIAGDIVVIEYRQPSYKEVASQQAAVIIRNVQPLILDVRTRGEFKRGHLKDAVLIPVQELQKRFKEISAYKNQDILIYCATGNRSTVASKILIDNGFKRIYNLRYGIYGWSKAKHPVVR